MAGITRCWIEEGQSISQASLDILIPTIREPGSEIWITMNRVRDTDPVDKMFLAGEPPPGSVVTEIEFFDNPFFPAELDAERQYLMRVDPEAAQHVWYGKTLKNSKAAVLSGKWFVEDFIPGEDWDGPYFGADHGFANDPATLVKVWIHGRTLYVEEESYGLGVEIVDLPSMYARIGGSAKYVIRADNARPEVNSYLQKNGYQKTTGCEKWQGSVEDGVTHLRSYERIVLHPRCRHTIEEAGIWSYAVDRLTGDILPKLVEKHDHCWDAIRYALGPMIKRSRLNIGDGKLAPQVGLGGGYWNQMG